MVASKPRCSYTNDKEYTCTVHVDDPLFRDVTGVRDDVLGSVIARSSLVDVDVPCSVRSIRSSLAGVVKEMTTRPGNKKVSLSIDRPGISGDRDVVIATRVSNIITSDGLESFVSAFASGLSDAQENCPAISSR
jgi:hypothetical protein